MPASHTLDFRPTDTKEKKIAILAVISFNEANSVPFSRTKLSEYFGINERTTRAWCAAAAAAAGVSSTSASASTDQPSKISKNTAPRGIKRSHSEEAMAEILSNTVTGAPSKTSAGSRLKTGTKKQKRLVKNESATPSPPPHQHQHQHQQLPTPPRRTVSQPRKRRQTTVSSLDFGMASSDEFFGV